MGSERWADEGVDVYLSCHLQSLVELRDDQDQLQRVTGMMEPAEES